MGVCAKYDYQTSTWTENKEPHYGTAYVGGNGGYVLAECQHTKRPKYYQRDRGFNSQERPLPPPLQLSTRLTAQNSTRHARATQAAIFKREGFVGPVKAGEVKALKNLLAKLNKTDHIVQGWMLKEVEGRWGRRVEHMYGPVYQFKSPIKGLSFEDFIMLARMYKDGKGLKDAVATMMQRLPSELKIEAETFRTVDVLAGLGETK